ncbi:tetratricopeptide (TPR) repeat protein [Haloferula luteola]|uniref:Tetratricopeptide (TPR) repeat protein n=1 Tax=Haloferula luteola TaxID=595692 RepID=A0A840V2P9_9BACT|nr:tetratricopeptide repeat protein [Haloferula luteola]MBB5352265.1 tetratricopeptide (TPR) repeat protein [Haloferula luteola]
MSEITVEQLDPSVKSLYEKAQAAVQKSNPGYAVKLLLSVVKDAPGFLEGRQLLRKCEAAATGGAKKKAGLFGMKSGGGLGTMKLTSAVKKDPLSALPVIEGELENDPYNPEVNDVLFSAFVALGWVDSAAFALETIRRGYPEQTKYLHKLADFYLSHSRSMNAAEVYRDIIKHDPTDSVAIKGEKDATARASMEKQKWGEGTSMKDLMRNKAEFEEMEKASRTGLTREQLEERRDDLAVKYAADQNNLAVVKELASVYERLEDWANAQSFYEWAFALSNGDVALRSKADAMSDKTKELEMADLERRVQENPDDPEVKAILEERRKARIAEAVADATRRVEQNPTDPILRYELGKALYDSGDFSGAIPQLQQAKRNPHIQSKVLLLLGRTFKAKGMLDMGVKQLESALEDLVQMDNTKKEVLYEKGLLHDEMGNKTEAIACFKEIYEVDYGYRDVAERVESSYSG